MKQTKSMSIKLRIKWKIFIGTKIKIGQFFRNKKHSNQEKKKKEAKFIALY